MRPTKIPLNVRAVYHELIEEIYQRKGYYNESELTLFTPGIGKNYNGDLMIIGRAVNGWRIYIDKESSHDKEEKLLDVENRFIKDDLQWVIDCWGNNDGDYNSKRSAFWRMANLISHELIGEDSLHKIAWTNLYKMSNENGGNPSGRLMNVQFEYCKRLLKLEIDLLKPKHIICLTGLSWATHFFKETQNELKQTGRFVEFVGQLGQSKIIVAQHPQGKPQKSHFQEIMSHLK